MVYMGRASRQKGFTIVELLIVVVVIAILAVITIVAYNGIAQRAKDSVAKNAISSAQKKLATYRIDNNDTLPADITSLGFINSANVTYQYSVNTTTNPAGYCVTATAGGVSYYLGSSFTYTGSSSGTIDQPAGASGVCPGHSGSGASVTNYARNPGVEVNTSGLSGPNGSTTVRDTTRAHGGVASLLVTMPVNGSSSTVGAAVFNYSDFTGILEPDTTYTVSLWVWVPTGTVSPLISLQGAGRTAPTNPSERTTSLKNQWVRLHNSFTTLASGNVVVYVLNGAATTVAGTQFWVDDIMLVKGTAPSDYADGNTSGWVWNGTAGSSASSGPAV